MTRNFVRPLALFAALAALGMAFPAAAEPPVKFSLDWKFEGPAAPFLLAKEKGYFAEEGLDVTIDTGAGSVEPINRVAPFGLRGRLNRRVSPVVVDFSGCPVDSGRRGTSWLM